MAGKARRAASRQGQLKRKRPTKGPGGIPSTTRRVTVPETDETAPVPAGVQEADIDPEALAAAEAAVAPPASRPATSRTPRGEFAAQGQGRLRGERPAAYLYLGSECRRILTLTIAILAALIVLGIVL
ncbi:MAG: hypothetical protein VYE35_07715 [Chloroflexota bacterium]|nr:hypothetical protein [Chloroflexota bacterium]